ncbi:MAG: hypothetical protein ACKO9T_00445, partial [Nitrospira sp.]
MNERKTDRADNTPAGARLRAIAISQTSGLRYGYAGAMAGQVGDCKDTHCHGCGETLLKRRSSTLLNATVAHPALAHGM